MLTIILLLLAAAPGQLPSKGKAAPSELAAGRVVSGSLEAGASATYRLRLKSGQRVEIDSLSSQIDTKLTLLDAAEKEIAANLDGGVNRNAKLHLQAPVTRAITHTYLVVVGNEAKQAGKYEILVRERTVAPPPEPTVIAVGQELKGELGPESPILPGDAHPYAVHRFQGRAGTRVRISLTSGAFDPKVYLRADGAAVADNDDGGAGNASQLVQRLEKDGTYEVWASTIDTLKVPSEYRLALAEVPEPAAAPTVEDIVWNRPLPGKVGDGDAVIKKFDVGIASPTRVMSRLPDGCALSVRERSHRLYRLAGTAGQRARLTLKRDGSVERCQVLVEVGVMSSAGFAWLSRRALVPAARFDFETTGEMLIRISVADGDNARYTLMVENETVPEPAPSSTSPVTSGGAAATGSSGD